MKEIKKKKVSAAGEKGADPSKNNLWDETLSKRDWLFTAQIEESFWSKGGGLFVRGENTDSTGGRRERVLT